MVIYGQHSTWQLNGHSTKVHALQITCGGLQSAHTAAMAAACAEHGIRAHLLIRGERPPMAATGYHLLSRLLGEVTYVPRSEYADRRAMFATHQTRVQAKAQPGCKVLAHFANHYLWGAEGP